MSQSTPYRVQISIDGCIAIIERVVVGRRESTISETGPGFSELTATPRSPAEPQIGDEPAQLVQDRKRDPESEHTRGDPGEQ